MNKEEYRQRLTDIRLKIAFLTPREKCNENHPLYKELNETKKEYALYLLEEREKEENDKHKGK